MCTAAKNCKKDHQNPSVRGSKSFKVIDIDKSKKPVTSACYDAQQVYTCLQLFSHYTSQQQQNNAFLEGMQSFERNPLTHRHKILSQ